RAVGRTAAATVDRAAAHGAAADLAARRADLGAGCGRADHVRRADARPSCARRPDRGGDARAARIAGQGAADRSRGMRISRIAAQSLHVVPAKAGTHTLRASFYHWRRDLLSLET